MKTEPGGIERNILIVGVGGIEPTSRKDVGLKNV